MRKAEKNVVVQQSAASKTTRVVRHPVDESKFRTMVGRCVKCGQQAYTTSKTIGVANKKVTMMCESPICMPEKYQSQSHTAENQERK